MTRLETEAPKGKLCLINLQAPKSSTQSPVTQGHTCPQFSHTAAGFSLSGGNDLPHWAEAFPGESLRHPGCSSFSGRTRMLARDAGLPFQKQPKAQTSIRWPKRG